MPRGSWFSQLPFGGWVDPEDKPGSNALGVPDSQQGIALPTRRGLGKWFLVTPPGGDGPYPLQQTDTGPAPFTGRGVDISAAGAHQMGYTPKTFPTDANFKVEPIDTTGLGLAAGYMGGVPGANDTMVAQGPMQTQGRKMPSSLLDMFQPTNAAGEPSDIGQALQSRSQSLIGLGLGLMSPAWQGESVMGNALKGYQAGAAADARQQALNESKAERKLHQSNWERQFARSDPNLQPTEWAKVRRDLGITPGSPEDLAGAKQFYQSRTEGDWTVQEDPNTGNKYAWNKRTNETKAIPVPGGVAAPGNPFQSTGKMTTDEGKTALYADRAATAHADITKYENLNDQPGGTVGGLVQQNLPAGAANVLVSGERGRAMDAQRAFVNALLRRESGAAINAGEFTSYAKEYFPQVGDTPAQIEAKRKHRAEVIAGLARESGRGYRPGYTFDDKGNVTLGKPAYQGGSQGGADPAAKPKPAATATKTINGKNYSKIDGQWYED